MDLLSANISEDDKHGADKEPKEHDNEIQLCH